jgi:glycosyltransferase involved in cell wall biosynthesis
MKSVLFYSDAIDYGGHEAMTAEAAACLCRDPKLSLSFAFYLGNKKLHEKLKSIRCSAGNLAIFPLPFKPKSLPAVRSLISWRQTRHIQRLMKRINPDVVVISHGRIEGSSTGLLAAKRSGFRTISYLPMAHTVAMSGRPFAVWIREMIDSYFYRLPDKFITISESARHMLRERGATSNVVVVRNAVEVQPIAESDRMQFRNAHGIGTDQYAVAIIGRIHFRQKGQDFALKTIDSFRDKLPDYRFVFIGDGPDAERFRAMVAKFNLTREVKLVPWTQNPTQIYAGVDMLLIPSRFEGVPLVMLEAMAYRLPIVATNVDGMADFLPPDWLFPFGNGAALIDTLLRVRESDNSHILELHRNQVMSEFSPQKFSTDFSSAICG